MTDGKAGDLNQCLGLAERLGLTADIRTVRPRAPWVWGMPLTWRVPAIAIDPAEAPGRPNAPLAGEMPDLVIASGRRAAPYLPAIKRESGGRAFTVFLKDPRTGAEIADFLWVPEHDALRGPNVMTTQLSPHRVSPTSLEVLRMSPPPTRIAALRTPRIAVLIGGNSKDFTFTDADITQFGAAIETLGGSGAGIMATTSRRTPPTLAETIRKVVETSGGWLWDGTGENPYRDLLAHADALVVTAESVNMVGEALATGRPVHLFRPTGGSRKIDQFLRGLEARGLVHPFSGAVRGDRYEPVDDTDAIAQELARRYARHRSAQARKE